MDYQIPTRKELYNKTKELIREYAISPQKTFGQHFLIEPEIINDLFSLSAVSNEDNIIEIGGGLGTLTMMLARLVNKVIVFEKDPLLATLLSQRFSQNNVQIMNQDFLEADLSKYDNFKIIANPPYEISSPIIFKALSPKVNIHSITLTLQKEYVSRLIAPVGSENYGKLTTAVSIRGNSKTGRTFPPAAFWPKPKIASTVVHIMPKEKIPDFVDYKGFKTLLTVIFNRKNKKLTNNIKSGLKFFTKTEKNAEEIMNYFKENFPHKRSINLSPEEIIELYKDIEMFIDQMD